MQKLLHIEETSELIGLAVPTIYKAVCQKKIPFIKIGGRLLFDPERLKKWVDSHKVEPIGSKQ